jgi:hypothetical protein
MAGASDAFVVKLDPDGVLLWPVFVGGRTGYGIAVGGDGDGAVGVCDVAVG